MLGAEWERVSELFAQAIELSGDEQQEFIETIAADNKVIAAEVRSLVHAHGASTSFLAKPLATTLLTQALNYQSTFVLELKKGEVIGNFEIMRTLGKGSFACVYLAKERGLERLVALKICPAIGREAQTMAVLEHDNIVQVFSEQLDVKRDIRIICMQYVDGISLRLLINKMKEYKHERRLWSGRDIIGILHDVDESSSAFDPAQARQSLAFESLNYVEAACQLTIDIAGALDHAHRIGVLHLDVKPDNILLNRYGRPLLTDFNVSLNHKVEQSLADGILGGTLAYMSPEHAQAFASGERAKFFDVHEQADVFSLGAVLCELVFGETDLKLVKPPQDSEAKELFEILKFAMHENPSMRYQNARELKDVLSGFLHLRDIRRQMPKHGLLSQACQRAPLLALVCGIAGPQILASIIQILYNDNRIVAFLSPSQRQVFDILLWVVNPINYTICTTWLLLHLWPLLNWMKCHRCLDLTNFQSLRHRALTLPTLIVALTSLGWGSAFLMFTGAIYFWGGPLSADALGHFAISFFISWLIALTYSYLFAQFFAIRIIYPNLLLGLRDIQATSSRELRAVGLRLRIFHGCAGAIPMLAATLLLVTTSDSTDLVHYQSFRFLVIGMIASGTLGFIIALRASEVLTKTLLALTGRET